MNKLKEKIQNKIDTIIRQYNLAGNLKVYIPILKEIENDFFFADKPLQEKSIQRLDSLLLTLRVWDSLDDSFCKNNEQKDKYKDRFVDDFNNFVELYEFMVSLVKDVETYHHQRLEKE